jgi:hypothetical protein
MCLSIGGRPAHGVIDGRTNADLVAGLDLLSEQVEGQRGMHAAHPRGVIAPTVMALGKDIDQVDAPQAQRFLELPLVKACAHPRNEVGSVKIEMDLSSGHGDYGILLPGMAKEWRREAPPRWCGHPQPRGFNHYVVKVSNGIAQ